MFRSSPRCKTGFLGSRSDLAVRLTRGGGGTGSKGWARGPGVLRGRGGSAGAGRGGRAKGAAGALRITQNRYGIHISRSAWSPVFHNRFEWFRADGLGFVPRARGLCVILCVSAPIRPLSKLPLCRATLGYHGSFVLLSAKAWSDWYRFRAGLRAWDASTRAALPMQQLRNPKRVGRGRETTPDNPCSGNKCL